MVCGTSSNAGKSLIVAALCRFFAKKGYDVAPFKAQNMSLNSYVTRDGKEIAFAQAYQAFAAGIEPDERMNPILLKPKGNFTSQLVVLGEAVKDVDIRSYWKELSHLKVIVRRAYESLMDEFDIVIIEGAGGMAEINLYDRDLANIYMARIAKPDILIVGDIDRGGVFASLYGTYHLLPADIKKYVKGFIINKLRGREDILEPGIRKIERICRVPVLGVIPYIDAFFPSEDSLNIEDWSNNGENVAIVRFRRVSNFTDFEPIRSISKFVDLNSSIKDFDIVVLPGSKDTIADLKELKESVLGEEIVKYAGKKVIVGICGGYQMLGRELIDYGIEHGTLRIKGLGLLDSTTEFKDFKKKTVQVVKEVTGSAAIIDKIKGEKVWGYEIHKGITHTRNPIFEDEGCASEDGMVWGTYLHGLFWNECIIRALSDYLGVKIRREESWIELITKEVEKLNLKVLGI